MAPGGSDGKLSALEQKIHKVGMAAPNATITQNDLFAKAGLTVSPTTQDALNTLLRKNLITMFRNAKNLISFSFSSRDEAKSMGSLDSDEKLVYDQIKDSGNQGIWTKTLKTKTGLHATIITRVIKALEGKKQIKVVKSVKNPTRKIYMLSTINPSVELTGGPWFTDNELDTEFVDALKSCARKYLSDFSIPSGDREKLFATSATPLLPTAENIRAYISSINVAAVELLNEHVEDLLDLMVFDGTVEKIMVAKNGGDGRGAKKRSLEDSSGSEDEDSDVPQRAKGRAKKLVKKTKKKARKVMGDESEEEEESEKSEEESFDEDEDPVAAAERRKAAGGSKKRKAGTSRRRKEQARSKRAKEEDDDDARSDVSMSSGNESEVERQRVKKEKKLAKTNGQAEARSGFVYRLVKSYRPRIGWTEMPCGTCPSEAFCSEPTRPRGPHHSRASVSEFGSRTGSTRGANLLGRPRISLGFDGMMQGVGMLGGQGAAIGTSNDKWGDTSGIVGGNVAPVNPKDCHYMAEWLIF